MLRNALRTFSGALMLAAFICSFGQVKISGASVNVRPDCVAIHVDGTDIPQPKLISDSDNFVIVQFLGELQTRARTLQIGKFGVLTAKLAQFAMRPARVRIAIRHTKPVAVVFTEDVDGWNIIISTPKLNPSTNAEDHDAMAQAIQQLAADAIVSTVAGTPKTAPDTEAKDKTKTQNTTVSSNQDSQEMKQAIQQLANETSQSAAPSNPEPKTTTTQSKGVKTQSPVTENTPVTSIPKMIQKEAALASEVVKSRTTVNTAKIRTDDKTSKTKTKDDDFGALPPIKYNGTVIPSQYGRVNLDFSDADVVAVLKALSLQVNVNIIISPGVTGGAPEAEPKGNPILPAANSNEAQPANPNLPAPGAGGTGGAAASRRITLSLKNVTVEEALDLVTALSGLRYAKIGNSYIVTTKAEYADTVRQLADRGVASNEVRVLPIISGQSAQIKDALYRWFGRETIEIYLPSEAGSVSPQISTTTNSDGSKTSQASYAKSPAASDPYIVLIGSKKWVDQAETLARQLDLDIIQTQKLKEQIDRQRARERAQMDRMGAGTATRAIYEVQNGKADELKKAITESFVDVHIMTSPANSQKQVMILEGPDDQVQGAMESLAQLDTGTVYGNDVAIYNVKFGDPRALREELIVQVPGLRCTVGPNHAATPTLYNPGESAAQGTQSTQGSQAASGGTQQAEGGQGETGGAKTTGGVKGDTAEVKGLALPFENMESTAVPMKLILRGTPDQINEAIAYLAKIDVAPKQLALELRVMELTKEDAINAGIDWNLFTGGAVKLIRLNNSQSDFSNSTNVHIRGGGDVTASLDAIANRNNLIARPNLLAVDGRQTEIFVGDVIRYVESITSSQNGPSITAKELRVGVRLAVLPRIGDDGNITMDMRPVVSFLKGFSQPVEGVNLPQTSERVVQTTVNLKSGETIALGGLIQDEDRRQASGVPILMDLPIVGQLFRKTTNTRVKTEIVFFLTVRSIDGPATAANVPLPPSKEGGMKSGGGK